MKRTSGRLALLLLAWVAVFGADKAEKGAKKNESYAVILATVFRETGHAMPGAELALVADPEPAVADAPKRKVPKPVRLASSMRGEAVFRIAPGPMRYNLSVEAKGYKPLSKSVFVQADERQDVNFLLEVEK